MFYVLRQGLDSVEELDRVEAKEKRKAVKAEAASSAIAAVVDPVKGINQFTVNLGNFVDIGLVVKGSSLSLSTPGSSS